MRSDYYKTIEKISSKGTLVVPILIALFVDALFKNFRHGFKADPAGYKAVGG